MCAGREDITRLLCCAQAGHLLLPRILWGGRRVICGREGAWHEHTGGSLGPASICILELVDKLAPIYLSGLRTCSSCAVQWSGKGSAVCMECVCLTTGVVVGQLVSRLRHVVFGEKLRSFHKRSMVVTLTERVIPYFGQIHIFFAGIFTCDEGNREFVVLAFV